MRDFHFLEMVPFRTWYISKWLMQAMCVLPLLMLFGCIPVDSFGEYWEMGCQFPRRRPSQRRGDSQKRICGEAAARR